MMRIMARRMKLGKLGFLKRPNHRSPLSKNVISHDKRPSCSAGNGPASARGAKPHLGEVASATSQQKPRGPENGQMFAFIGLQPS